MNNTKIIVGHIIHVLNSFSQSSAQSFYYYIVSRVHQEKLCTTIGNLQTIGLELLAVDFFVCKYPWNSGTDRVSQVGVVEKEAI